MPFKMHKDKLTEINEGNYLHLNTLCRVACTYVDYIGKHRHLNMPIQRTALESTSTRTAHWESQK